MPKTDKRCSKIYGTPFIFVFGLLLYACCGYNPGMSVCFFSMAMALIRSSRFSSCSR